MDNDLKENIKNLRESIAKTQTIKGEKVYVGNDATNVLQALADLAGVVEAIANAYASHGHGSNGGAPPANGASIAAQGIKAATTKTKVEAMV